MRKTSAREKAMQAYAKQENLKATRRGAVKSVFEKAGRLKQERRKAYSA